MSVPRVFIVLLTYNSKREAQCCLRSLQRLAYPNYRIIVVDNGSSDGTEAMLRNEFASLVTIQTGENLGYTGGNNRGINYALSQNADYVLVLNPDTVLVNPHFIDEMVAHMETHPEVGIAGPRVFGPETGSVQNTVLFTPGLWRNIVHWVRYRINPHFAHLSGDRIMDAEVLNGVCILIRASCLRQIGLFDPNIFMYIEDVDMDHRAHRHGWRVRYLPVDSVVHQRRSGDCHSTSLVNFLLKRNTVYYLHKAGRSLEAWSYAVISLAMIAIHILWPFRRSGVVPELCFLGRLWAAYRQIFKGIPYGQSFGPPYA